MASALALPEETLTGLPFPYRSLIALLAVAMIIATLVVQGLSLRPLIRWLRVPSDRSSESELLTARIHTTEQVLDFLSNGKHDLDGESAALARVRGFFEDRLADLRSSLEIENGTDAPDRPEDFATIAEQRLWWETARVERRALLDLRHRQQISDEAMREIQRDIDLLEARIIPAGAA
jgi:CPA1 family monovalent cation:H+ antiporter